MSEGTLTLWLMFGPLILIVSAAALAQGLLIARKELHR